MSDICSIWAYEDIVTSGWLGDKQARVLAIFTRNPEKEFTASEIKRGLIIKSMSETVRNRITELNDMGFLEKVSIVFDEITEKHVNTWRWTGRKIPLPKSSIELCCPRCKGSGKITRVIYGEYDRSKDSISCFSSSIPFD